MGATPGVEIALKVDETNSGGGDAMKYDAAFPLIVQQRSVSGSLTGAPAMIATMLEFASRHDVVPQNEHFPMSDIEEAFGRLDSGKARYRIVLDADFRST